MPWHSNQRLRLVSFFVHGGVTFDSRLPGRELSCMAAMALKTGAISRREP